jgi:NAD(P) transhydrogenase
MVNKENQFHIDLEDDVVGIAIVTHKGDKLWPNPKPLPMLDAAPKKVDAKKLKKDSAKESVFSNTLKTAVTTGTALASIIGVGALCPDPMFLGMVTTFSLAVIAGYQSVWGVVPALHTPLMSITNAISGLTAAGGLLCLGGGLLPHTIPQFLAASAVLVSSINIGGGFCVTKRMLDMFKRKGDAPEHNYLYGISGAAMMGTFLAANHAGIANIY